MWFESRFPHHLYSTNTYSYIDIKFKFKYDDALDIVGVHGVGGFVGIVLVAIFASAEFGGSEAGLNISKQLGIQLYAGLFAILYTIIVTVIIVKLVDLIVGLRVTDEQEIQGVDVMDHGEAGYDL